jgi:ribosomal-protein-serine acetyltransferase
MGRQSLADRKHQRYGERLNTSTLASTADIVLRPLVEDDADALCDAVRASMATLSQWLPWATSAYARTDAETWIAHCRKTRASEDEYHFGVFDAASGDLLGGVGLNHRLRVYRSAHVGYWVADAVRGRGIAGAAVRQAATIGFETLGLQRIAIMIQPENRASLRVAMKLGAVCEGIARNAIVVAGRSHEAMVYSLLPEDLQGNIDH